MQYGDRPCLRTFVLMTTADTAAELGCKRWQSARACVCRMIRPGGGSGERCSCAAGATGSPWCAGREAAYLPGRFSRRTVPAALFFPFFYNRQVVFSGISAVPAAGSRRRSCERKKTREQTTLWVKSDFSCLRSFQIFNSRCAARGTGSYYFMVIPEWQ